LKQIRDAASYPVRSAGAALDSRERDDDEGSRAKRRRASGRVGARDITQTPSSTSKGSPNGALMMVSILIK
jgi:hypothetical protein